MSLTLSDAIHLLGDTPRRRAPRPGIGRPLRDGRSGARARQGAARGRPAAPRAARRGGGPARRDAARATASAFAIYFDLVNLAEESTGSMPCARRARAQHPAPIGESVGAAIARLKAQGITPARMAALLAALRVELVLTAHPTEAKRRTVLSKLQRIGELLRRLHDPDLLPARARGGDGGAPGGDHRALAHRPGPHHAAGGDRRGPHGALLRRVHLLGCAAAPQRRAGGCARRAFPRCDPPPRWLTLASWIGGDRDGNPSVVTAVTAETLRLHRGLAVERHRRSLRDAARRLSVSGRRCPPPPALAAWLEARRPAAPARGLSRAALRQRALPPRALAPRRRSRGRLRGGHDGPPARRYARIARAPPWTRWSASLDLVARAVPPDLAEDGLGPLRAQLDCFGLHAARLDIREDSGRLAAALGGILAGLGRDAAFAERDEEGPRAERLLDLIAESRPSPRR